MPSRVVKNPAPLTRKQRHHIRRDQAQTRWVWAITAIILVLVAAVIGFGYYSTYFLRVVDPAAFVYGEKITISEVQKEVRWERMQLIASYSRLILASNNLQDPTQASVFNSQASQIANMLNNKTALGEDALGFLIEARIARHEAASRGIVVTEDELQAKVNDMLGYIPEATLTALPSPSNTVPFTPTPTWTVTSTVTPGGPTFTPTSTITLTPTVTLTPTLAGTVTPTLAPSITRTPTLVPTATPFTQAAFQKYYTLYLGDVRRMTMMTELDFRERARSELYIAKVKNAVMAEVPRNEDQVHLAQIVVADEATGKAVRARVVGGESWNAVAKEVSLDTATKDSGGDLGWIAEGNPPSDLEKTAFAMNYGQISQPVPTSATTWVILKLVDKGSRPMSADKYAGEQQAHYQQWLQDLEKNSDVVEKKGIPADLIPTDPKM